MSRPRPRNRVARGKRPGAPLHRGANGTCGALWRRGQDGWPRSFPLAQFPNPPLLIAFAGWLLAAVTDGGAHDIGRAVFTIGLSIWAWLEATAGVNWLRRLIGAGALVWVVIGLAGDL